MNPRKKATAKPTVENTDVDTALANYPIGIAVERALRRYFKDLDGTDPVDLYQLFVNEVEKPLLRTVIGQAQGNCSRAAEMLGINRNTLRKKMRLHSIDHG